jgi:hypothetical protein
MTSPLLKVEGRHEPAPGRQTLAPLKNGSEKIALEMIILALAKKSNESLK